MTPSLVLAALVTAAPVKLALVNLTGVGFTQSQSEALSEHLSSRFRTVSVVTPKDIAALLGLERQKQLLACSEASCNAELANALGVDGIVQGELTRLGQVIQLNVKCLATSDGRRLAVYGERVSREEDLFSAVERAAAAIETQTLEALLPAAPSADRRFSLGWTAVPLGLSVLAGVAGAIFMVLAGADYRALGEETVRFDGPALKARGELRQGLAIGGFSLCGAGAVVAVVMFALAGTPAEATGGNR
jgi:hypothetical protein